MRPVFRLIIFLLAAVFPAAHCFGGTLVISSRSTLTITANRIRVDVFAENRGNEPAYGVQAHLYIFGRTYSAGAVDQLEVKKIHTFQFAVPLPPDLKGEFPFVGEVLYHDGNRRSAAALSAGVFKLGSSGGALLSGRAPEIILTANERLSVKIRSRDPAIRDVVATLYLPPSLTTSQKQKQIQLKPFETATVEFTLKRRYGTGSATYPVFCILTAGDGAETQAAVVQTAVQVKDFQNWFVKTRRHWLNAGGLIVLGWVWIGMQRSGVRDRKERLKA